MKFVLAVFVALGLTIGSGTAAPVLTLAGADRGSAANVDQGQPPSGQLDVTVDVDRDGAAWYSSPVWIAIGVVSVILIVALIITATRSSRTTIVKE